MKYYIPLLACAAISAAAPAPQIENGGDWLRRSPEKRQIENSGDWLKRQIENANWEWLKRQIENSGDWLKRDSPVHQEK
ncbi:hypothetical protein DL89DRAFT_266613 [Linderina pennispora]|uniref:Uncharacterized protein n=1 Tax=Linderina pennispora TaxID=61395 RepID=A0A1Y1WDK8_9FUNG|nr:uncharacterized protein DL89DRAFT_266613 [Linderina pennispora]ORX71617.1 hypothetical protein DL89DRAFT_266613 [Linderina pennispora]